MEKIIFCLLSVHLCIYVSLYLSCSVTALAAVLLNDEQVSFTKIRDQLIRPLMEGRERAERRVWHVLAFSGVSDVLQ